MSSMDTERAARLQMSLQSSPQPSAQPSHLIRGLGLWSATAIVIGDTIGTGIFLVTSDMARAVSSVRLVFAAWLIGGLIVLFGAFCYAELGAAFPKAGGPYVYLSRGLSPLWGFLFGWMSSFLERPVAMATLAAGFLRFVGFLFPVVATPLFTWHINWHLGNYDYTCTAAQPLAAAVVLAVTAINYLSVRIGGSIQVLLTSLKIGTILLIVVAGALFAKQHAIAATPLATPLGLGTIGAVLTALVPAMWAYNGFNDLGDLGEEILQPEKNIPRAIILGLLTVCGLYLLANVVYFHVLPLPELARSYHLASDVVQSLAGSRGAIWLTIAMAASALGALHVVVLTGARIPYAMARDGAFFQFAARLHPSFRTPSGSLLFLGSIAALLALSGTYEELYSLFVFAVWIFFALTALALFRLRKKEPGLIRPYRAWGYPWTPLIFLVAAIALTLNLWMARPVRSSLGLAVILAGIPFFFRWRKSLRAPTGPSRP
jgi:APA family basic amino acid/polyamine antiporter